MKDSTKAKIEAMSISDLEWHRDNETKSEFRDKEKRKYICDVLAEKQSALEESKIDKLVEAIATNKESTPRENKIVQWLFNYTKEVAVATTMIIIGFLLYNCLGVS